MEKNVTIVITEKGWETKVQLGKKTFIEKHESTSTGSKCIEGNFEKHDEFSEDLLDSLTSFAQYDIMYALRNNPE